MPELPEVETITKKLAQVLPGKIIQRVVVFHPKSFIGDPQILASQKILKVFRRAKMLSLEIQDNKDKHPKYILIHLKMTGQLMFVRDRTRVAGGHPSADWVKTLPNSHTRVSYHFTDNSILHFNDMRIFGWNKLISKTELDQQFQKLGPDINDTSLTADYLMQKFKNRSSFIKKVLLDPAVVAGLGNIYVCEALNKAQISPFKPAKVLTKKEIQKLLLACQEVIELGIDRQGTTFDGKYLTADGFSGSYQDIALVYLRAGLPCYNCGSKIKKSKIAGRGTFYCEVCQL
jgi:formamidopyrimidine-DNA glycosylase